MLQIILLSRKLKNKTNDRVARYSTRQTRLCDISVIYRYGCLLTCICYGLPCTCVFIFAPSYCWWKVKSVDLQLQFMSGKILTEYAFGNRFQVLMSHAIIDWLLLGWRENVVSPNILTAKINGLMLSPLLIKPFDIVGNCLDKSSVSCK